LTATYSATLNSDSSTAPMASVRRCARHSPRAAAKPTTSPASANFVLSHGRTPSRAKHTKASRRDGLASSRRLSSADAARIAPAASSG